MMIDAERDLARVESDRRSILPLRIERVSADKLYAITAEWADLCGRTMEPNIFLEPSFALPLMNYVAPARRPGIVLVWEDGDSSRLLALLPVAGPTWSSPGLVRAFRDEQAPLGTPLLDRVRGVEAFTAILATLATRWPHAEAIAFTQLPRDGAVARMLRARALERLSLLGGEERAVVRPTCGPASDPMLDASAKRRKELRRQRRQLASLGTLATVSATDPEEVAAATERFLVLERSGWKGARGTALLSNIGRAAFTRTALRRMAEAGMCRIDTLMLDDKPVAMGIVLTRGSSAHWWKTAYDERFATFSPGVQFAVDLLRRQQADPGVTSTDSCAVAGHSMIERLWLGRLPLVDVAVSLRPRPDRRFQRVVRWERSRRALRAWAKTRWHSLRQR